MEYFASWPSPDYTVKHGYPPLSSPKPTFPTPVWFSSPTVRAASSTANWPHYPGMIDPHRSGAIRASFKSKVVPTHRLASDIMLIDISTEAAVASLNAAASQATGTTWTNACIVSAADAGIVTAPFGVRPRIAGAAA